VDGPAFGVMTIDTSSTETLLEDGVSLFFVTCQQTEREILVKGMFTMVGDYKCFKYFLYDMMF
jgi:hypothetical protein